MQRANIEHYIQSVESKLMSPLQSRPVSGGVLLGRYLLSMYVKYVGSQQCGPAQRLLGHSPVAGLAGLAGPAVTEHFLARGTFPFRTPLIVM